MALDTIMFGSLSYTKNSSLAKARFPCPTELEFQIKSNFIKICSEYSNFNEICLSIFNFVEVYCF